jgi:5-methylcytosine-specific restriction endonuclease McrA
MNYENKGLYNGELNYGWDIDHIIPLSSIDKNLTEEERFIKLKELNHYTNLQPLCSKINRDIKRNYF